MHYPTPEEIERAIGRARRLRAKAFLDVMRVAAKGLARAFRGGMQEPAPADGGATHAHAG
jgi:hypothetical protein